MKKQQKNGEIHRCFTLLELLIVVSVIMILLSLLLPAISNAKTYAKKILCSQQLKQIGVAVHMYASDNNGWKPQDPAVVNFLMAGRVNTASNRDIPSVLYLNGYLGPIKTGHYDILYRPYFKCPMDEFWWYHKSISEESPGGQYISYYYFCVYPGAPGYSREASRNRITDRPQNAIFADIVPYQNYILYNHKAKDCNVLHLDGHVNNVLYKNIDPSGVSWSVAFTYIDK